MDLKRSSKTKAKISSKKRPNLFFSPTEIKKFKTFLKTKPLLAFDFDGTLVPVVHAPQIVETPPAVLETLKELNRKFTVVILSGRQIPVLKTFLPGLKVRLIGNHGLEGFKNTPPASTLGALTKDLKKKTESLEGITVENKKYSITVHYRHSPNKPLARRKVLDAMLAWPKYRVIHGKSVFNIIPDTGLNKGTALLRLMREYKCSTSFFMGDDITDEDVFILKNKNVFSVKIGIGPTHAKHYISSQKYTHRILELINQYDG